MKELKDFYECWEGCTVIKHQDEKKTVSDGAHIDL